MATLSKKESTRHIHHARRIRDTELFHPPSYQKAGGFRARWPAYRYFWAMAEATGASREVLRDEEVEAMRSLLEKLHDMREVVSCNEGAILIYLWLY